MLPNFELRFVNRVVSGRQVAKDVYEANTIKILQYRTIVAIDDSAPRWSKWADVPVEDE